MAQLFAAFYRPKRVFRPQYLLDAEGHPADEEAAAEQAGALDRFLKVFGAVPPDRLAWVREQVRELGRLARAAGLRLEEIPVVHVGRVPVTPVRPPTRRKVFSLLSIAAGGEPIDQEERTGLEPTLLRFLESSGKLRGPIIVLGELAGRRPPTLPKPRMESPLPDLGVPIELRVGEPRGGLYRAPDGALHDVVIYRDPAQAMGHFLVDRLFGELGRGGPESALESYGEAWMVRTRRAEQDPGTLSDADLTPAAAAAAFKAFAAVLLVKHWGVPGEMRPRADGEIERGDNGASLLWRSREKRKNPEGLHDMSEAVSFFDYPHNKSYSPLAHAAGYASVFDVPDFARQVQDILDLRSRYGGWDAFVGSVVPQMPGADREAIVAMLEARTEKLRELLTQDRPSAASRLERPMAARQAPVSTDRLRVVLPGVPRRSVGVLHPCRDDRGNIVEILSPTLPSPPHTWADGAATAVFVPGGAAPETLHGVSLAPWTEAPTTPEAWNERARNGGDAEAGRPFHVGGSRRAQSGVVIVEPDGRFWLVEPTNHPPEQLANTFPHAVVHADCTTQASALRVAFERCGLQIRLVKWIGDYTSRFSVIRYFLAVRVGGSPAAAGHASQAVKLVASRHVVDLLATRRDHQVFNDAKAAIQAIRS